VVVHVENFHLACFQLLRSNTAIDGEELLQEV